MRCRGKSAKPGNTADRYSRIGIFRRRQLSTTDKIAATFGPACWLPKEIMVPIRNGSCVQISFSELLLRYLQKTQETVEAETSRPKGRKIIYLPTRRSDDSCKT